MKRLILIVSLFLCFHQCTFANGHSEAEEIQVRFSTERLNPSQKLEVIRGALSQSELKDRVEIYALLFKDLKSYGFQQQEVDALFRGALEDLKRVPPKMFKTGSECYSASEALGCFAHESLRFALSNLVMSPPLAHEYLLTILKAPWLDLLMIQDAAWLMGAFSNVSFKYPYYREAHELIMAAPSFQEYTAEKIIMGLIEPPLCGMVSCGVDRPFIPSWKDKAWLLKKVLATGKVPAEQVKNMGQYLKQFALGESFELRATGALSSDAKLLQEMIARPENAPLVADIAAGWLVQNKVPTELREALVESFMGVFARIPAKDLYMSSQHTTNGALYVLDHFLTNVELPEALQERLMIFLINKTSEDSKANHHIRYLIVALPFEPSGTPVPIGRMQKPLELLASTASAGDSESDFIGDENTRNDSLVGSLLNFVESCKKPELNFHTRAKACESITDERAIFKAVAANPAVFPVQRERAKALAGN